MNAVNGTRPSASTTTQAISFIRIVDYVGFIRKFADRIFHVHMKDAYRASYRMGATACSAAISTLAITGAAWDFVSLGRGVVNFEAIIPGAESTSATGARSRWSGRTAGWTASRAPPRPAAFVKRLDFAPSALAFDAAFASKMNRNQGHVRSYVDAGVGGIIMSEGTGFTAMAAGQTAGEAPEVGVGMLGYAFMGKAHSNAMKKIPYMMYPPVAIPKLVAISGRDEAKVAEAAKRFGYQKYYTDWRAMIEDPDVQLVDNGGPNNLHADPSILAAQLGKHVLCEKPLARTAAEAKAMWDAVETAKIKHMVAFNYRFVPAVRMIRDLIDQGAFGRIYHFRAMYLQEWIMPHYGTPIIWRLEKDVAGSGALGDLGAHIIDLAHYLVGGVKSVSRA